MVHLYIRARPFLCWHPFRCISRFDDFVSYLGSKTVLAFSRHNIIKKGYVFIKVALFKVKHPLGTLNRLLTILCSTGIHADSEFSCMLNTFKNQWGGKLIFSSSQSILDIILSLRSRIHKFSCKWLIQLLGCLCEANEGLYYTPGVEARVCVSISMYVSVTLVWSG